MSKTPLTAKEIQNNPHATFCGRLEHGYGKVSMCLYFDTGYAYGPGALTLTAQIGTEYVGSVKDQIQHPARRAYGTRIEVECRNGVTAHRLRYFANILARFEKRMSERDMHLDYAAFGDVALLLMEAAGLRYAFLNPVNQEGHRVYASGSNIDTWLLRDMTKSVDAASFGLLVQETVNVLWRKATPLSAMRAAQDELGSTPAELRAA